MSSEDRHQLRRLLLTLPFSNKMKFKSMCKDISAISKGTESPEVLLAYAL